MKHPQMGLTVSSGGVRSDTAPLAPGKQPCLVGLKVGVPAPP